MLHTLTGRDDEVGFGLSLGGKEYKDTGKVFFFPRKGGEEADEARNPESWQVLSPVRSAGYGVDAINRALQVRYRGGALKMATPEVFWHRKIPAPAGPQGILWGDKVINVRNNGRRHTWPKIEAGYVANGDIGIVAGQYKTKTLKGMPENLEVEFASQPGVVYKYWKSEFSGDEANPELELAYALTVHKTQGSEFGTTFVVLPKACRLLSRELLYTALTRHEYRLVILHEGPFRDFRGYGHEGKSEIAGRMTNLFRDANPREVTVDSQRRFLEDGLIHRTEHGELVRSKSEVVIADKLHARKIDYAYEAWLTLEGGAQRSPDFTITDAESGTTFYWEHLGMLEDPSYAARWKRKADLYRRSGILPYEEGGGPKGTLLVTRDSPAGGIDAAAIAKLIDEVIRGE